MNRFAAVHASPMLRILASIAPSTAASRSASAITRNGAFPPSSIETRSSCWADCSTSRRPIAVDPVKVSLRTRGSRISGSITAPLREVVITFSTPSGSPASRMIPASAYIDNGVCAAGFTSIVQPAATAGPILRVPIANGKFHGVIINVGPTGRFIVINRVAPSGEVDQRPAIRTASSLNQRKNSAAYVTSPRDSTSGLPISNVINNASSSARAVISSNARRRISPRSRGAVARPALLRRDRHIQRRHTIRRRRIRHLRQHLPRRRVMHRQHRLVRGRGRAPTHPQTLRDVRDHSGLAAGHRRARAHGSQPARPAPRMTQPSAR